MSGSLTRIGAAGLLSWVCVFDHGPSFLEGTFANQLDVVLPASCVSQLKTSHSHSVTSCN